MFCHQGSATGTHCSRMTEFHSMAANRCGVRGQITIRTDGGYAESSLKPSDCIVGKSDTFYVNWIMNPFKITHTVKAHYFLYLI